MNKPAKKDIAMLAGMLFSVAVFIYASYSLWYEFLRWNDLILVTLNFVLALAAFASSGVMCSEAVSEKRRNVRGRLAAAFISAAVYSVLFWGVTYIHNISGKTNTLAVFVGTTLCTLAFGIIYVLFFASNAKKRLKALYVTLCVLAVIATVAVIGCLARSFYVTEHLFPMTPIGEELDLDGYDLVFYDEFDGDELDTDVWEYRASGERRNGFNAPSQVSVKDGNLVISAEYLENGDYGAGWYAGMIRLRQKYTRGYFEIRCICNDGPGFWSAFWIQADSPYDHYLSNGGIGGAELDIFESLHASEYKEDKRNCVAQNVHCNGSDDDIENIDSLHVGSFMGNNIYEEYNTYGLKWTEDEYTFYINGVATAKTTWGKGVSQVPEEVIVSLELPDKIPSFGKDYKTQFVVDYVKIYQIPD